MARKNRFRARRVAVAIGHAARRRQGSCSPPDNHDNLAGDAPPHHEGTMKLAIPDLISNSYFPALAASELGFFEREGVTVATELIFPVDRAYAALRNGDVDFVGGAAHGALAAFPEWRGVKLLGALAQGMYWFLVMRADLGIARGDLAALKGRHIGAAPWVEMGLRRLLVTSGIDPIRDHIEIGPIPGATGSTVNFGLTAAEALDAGKIDGFWANGMATELAVTTGVGAIVLDVRRGDGPPGCFDYTMPVLATTDRLIERSPETAAAAVRAPVATQNALKQDVSRATDVGHKRFPPREAGLIAGIVRRDLPFYDASIDETSVSAINAFAGAMGVLAGDVPYDRIVATRFSHLWLA
jgi:NitT/TauT family transport system substrate-binding protein